MRFSRDELPAILGIPASAVDALIRSGVLAADRDDAVAVQSIEALLRDTLIRLYRAEANAPEVEIALPEAMESEEEPLVTHSIAEFQETEDGERANQRLAPRYLPKRSISGAFRQTRFNILQISASGLRIRHDETLRPGDEARVHFSIVKPARSFAVGARVVWTSIAQRGDGPSFCVSGLRIVSGADQVREAISILLAARELEPEPQRTPKKSAPLAGLSDDDIASVIRAVRVLSSDPFEANRWYTRARFAVADENVRRAAPSRPREREEVLAVWEYLKRSIDLKAVTAVVSWIHQTRSAVAV